MSNQNLDPQLISIGVGDPPTRPKQAIVADLKAAQSDEWSDLVMRIDSEKLETALREFAATGNVSQACLAAGLSRRTLLQRRKLDSDFAMLWDAAREIAVDGLEQEARRRAVDGVDEPVFYQGEKCGTIRRYSDNLLAKLLQAHRPHLFRERHSVAVEEISPNADIWKPDERAATIEDRAQAVIGVLMELGVISTTQTTPIIGVPNSNDINDPDDPLQLPNVVPIFTIPPAPAEEED